MFFGRIKTTSARIYFGAYPTYGKAETTVAVVHTSAIKRSVKPDFWGPGRGGRVTSLNILRNFYYSCQ